MAVQAFLVRVYKVRGEEGKKAEMGGKQFKSRYGGFCKTRVGGNIQNGFSKSEKRRRK